MPLALVHHGDAGVAHELLHAVLGDVAMPAVDLLREHRVGETLIGQHALITGVSRPCGRRPPRAALVAGAVRDVAAQRGPHQGARGLVEGADAHQHAPHVGMDDDRIGGPVGKFRAGERAALQAVLRIGRGVLIGDLGERQLLHADGEPRLVHHREHGVDAALLLPDQPAGGAVIVHHAGGVAVNAHLPDRAARHRVASAERAVGVAQTGTTNSEMPLMPAGAFGARQHQVHDVLGQIVLAGGDEDLNLADPVAAVGLLHRLAADEPEIGAAVHGSVRFMVLVQRPSISFGK